MERKSVTTSSNNELLKAIAFLQGIEKRIDRISLDMLELAKEGKKEECRKLNEELEKLAKMKDELKGLIEESCNLGLLDKTSLKKEELYNVPQNSTENKKIMSCTEKPKIKPLQESFIYLIVQGTPIKSISEELNVDRKTLYNWLEDDAVKQEIYKVRYILYTQRTNKLITLQSKATEVLMHALDSDNPNIRLKAATYILEKIDNSPPDI